MNAAVIKIKDAKRPAEGKKQATIYTEDGQTFGVWPDKFGLFQPGRSYRVEFQEREWNGKKYKTIVKCEPAAEVEERANDRGTDSQRSSPNQELEFVTRLLAASIQACAVGHTQEALTNEACMLRQVYREAFR